MLILYYTFWQDNVWSAPPEWIQQFETSIQVAYAKIDKYTPRDWRMYNEGKVSGYTDGYNQGSWKGMIMAGTKPKNIIRKYSKESLEKLNSNGRKKVRITSILRK
jgi:predicted DNA-binding transcriptional regulator